MRILLACNPRSGRGRAARLADSTAAALRTAGHEPRILPIGPDHPDALALALNDPASQRPDVLAIAGGDGTIHHALAATIAAQVPIYHLPTGTENLFARHFGMTADPAMLLRALERCSITTIDTARCNDTPFALMCSIGADASIVHRLSASRRDTISHLSYLRPIAAELAAPCLPRLTITADDVRLADAVPAIAIVSNSPHYAMRLNPNRRASVTDGLLDLTILPCRSGLGLLAWIALLRAGLHTRRRGVISRTARRITISTPDRAPCQLDGEAAACTPPLTLTIAPATLRVLQP